MEDVLDVYAEPYDPTRPKVNFDETNKQRLQETRQPLLAQPGRPQRYDYEYARNGTRHLLLFVEPQAGRRHVRVTEQRTKAEARLIAEACSAAPEGRQRWTLHLLADRVVALGLATAYSYESVRRVLKKRSSSRG